jgi:hypothetical protein
MFPSGLDFLVASPTLCSPAAVRALELQSGKAVAAAVQKFNCEPFPNSLHGDAMMLLALLQKTPPAQAPPALRTDAWADQQLWTQLGAWAEQRHTWALHTKLSVMYMGMSDTPAGIVAPYPEFFIGLAALARKTADALNQAGLTEPFDARAAATEMLSQIVLRRQARSPEARSRQRNEEDWMKEMEKTAQFERFFSGYFEKFASGLKDSQAMRKAEEKTVNDLETLTRRVVETGNASDAETETLKQFTSTARDNVPDLLKEFAPVCERLAELARKSLAGQKLTEDDAHWIRSYGTQLARFHFYEGNSYLTPLDNFPIATRIFANPFVGSVLYVGLGRPQALYVIVPDGGKQQLYQGAVMTYREFTRDADEPLDDESWRKIVFDGLTPSPPPFTRSFYAEADAKELMNIVRHAPRPKDFEGYSSRSAQAEQAAQLLRTRATAADLTDLIALLRNLGSEDSDVAVTLVQTISRLASSNNVASLIALLPEFQTRSLGWPDHVMPALADAIAPLPWEPHQAELIRLLAHSKSDVAAAAVHILASRPQALDVHALVADFDQQPSRARGLRLTLLGKTSVNADTRETLLHGLQDKDDSVRWQAVSAVYKAKWSDNRSTAALINRLDDTNRCVAAGAAHVLGKLGVTNAAPILLAKLQASKQAPRVSDEEWKRQTEAISQKGIEDWRWERDPDGLPSYFFGRNIGTNVLRAELMRILRPSQLQLRLPSGFTFDRAVIAALGELKHQASEEMLLNELGGENSNAAVEALKKLDPSRLEQSLFSLAVDRQAEGMKRGIALNAICDLAVTNRLRDLLPLLDETSIIMLMPRSPESAWRLCDHAAVVMARILEWETNPRLIVDVEAREELIKKLRDWAAGKP